MRLFRWHVHLVCVFMNHRGVIKNEAQAHLYWERSCSLCTDFSQQHSYWPCNRGVTRCPSLCGTAQHFIALSPLFHMLRQCPKFFLALQYLQFSKVWLLMHVQKAGKAFYYVQVEVSLSEPICAHQGKNSPEMNVTETTSKKMKRQWEIQFFFNFTQRKMWPEVTHKWSKSSDMALKKHNDWWVHPCWAPVMISRQKSSWKYRQCT